MSRLTALTLAVVLLAGCQVTASREAVGTTVTSQPATTTTVAPGHPG